MKAEIKPIGQYKHIIDWSDDNLGFGQITIEWKPKISRYVIDSELLSFENVIKIIKSIKEK